MCLIFIYFRHSDTEEEEERKVDKIPATNRKRKVPSVVKRGRGRPRKKTPRPPDAEKDDISSIFPPKLTTKHNGAVSDESNILDLEIKEEEGPVEVEPVPEKPVDDTVGTLYVCNICHRVTRTRGGLNRHQRRKHQMVDRDPASVTVLPPPSLLPLPPRRFRGKGRKPPRGKAPRKPLPPAEERVKFTCDICNHVTLTNRAMKDHKRARHENRRDFLCDECDMSYSYSECLRRHKLSKHNDSVHTCEICGFQTDYIHYLKTHHKKVHVRHRPVKCDQCDYRGENQYRIAKHIKAVHDKIKSHTCELCPFTTATSSSMVRHMNTVHKRGPVYQCPHCESSMNMPYNFRMHMKAVHKIVVPAGALLISEARRFPVKSLPKDEEPPSPEAVSQKADKAS
jgi:hypothetical protein